MDYSASFSAPISDGLVAGILALGVGALVVPFLWWLLNVIAGWRIFTKAGEPGWKSIIPVYSGYVRAKIAWGTQPFWIALGSGVLGTVLGDVARSAIDSGNTSTAIYVLMLLGAVCGLVSAIYNIRILVHLSKAYGHGVGFAIGLIFLNPIFMMILGFGSSQYAGPIE